jgi:cytoskeletal protein CcmA (bactofilin family)
MALVISDRVKETTTTTGTGTYTLGGAVTGFETFTANLSNSDTTYYCCTDGTDFEVGLGTFTSSGTTLARTTVISSSNSNNAVSWSSGTRTLFCTLPATKTIVLDASGNASVGGTVTATGTSVFTNLDISGDVDIDGTLEADAITVNGTALNTVIAGVTVTNATNATNATNSSHVLVTDNESTSEENLITFVEDATSSTGNVGLEMDGNLTYNPSSGTITATIFKGNIDAVDGDFDGTLEADAITVGGTALATVIAGTTVTTATNANHVSVADNENTNEENLIPFIEDASATGNVGLESDGDFAYNPSTGTVSATIFKGNIDAVDGDFDGTLEADAITLNGTAVTTTATLSTGISNGNVLVATSGIADNDFLRVDGTSIEGRSASEVLSDIGATTAALAADEATALAIALG